MSNVPMTSPADMESNSFFDHIDDLLDFNEDNNKTSGDGIAFSGVWNASPHSLLNPDSVIGTGCSADLAAELSIPYEDIVQMEWLSMFMEDSFGSGNTMTLDTRDFPAADDGVRVGAEAVTSPISVLESSSSSSSTSASSDGGKITPLSPEKVSLKGGCGRARSKRSRPLTFNLQLFSPAQSFMDDVGVSKVEFNESSSLKNGSAASGHKKLKSLKTKTGGDESSGEAGVRKCLHCEITKTPQWRTGPLGPKTLCNACGVRYKSGRLFPEYRPAASPTFVPSIHSNSHKKVLEMRTTTTHDNTPPTTTSSQGLMDDAGPEFVPNKDASII